MKREPSSIRWRTKLMRGRPRADSERFNAMQAAFGCRLTANSSVCACGATIEPKGSPVVALRKQLMDGLRTNRRTPVGDLTLRGRVSALSPFFAVAQWVTQSLIPTTNQPANVRRLRRPTTNAGHQAAAIELKDRPIILAPCILQTLRCDTVHTRPDQRRVKVVVQPPDDNIELQAVVLV